MADDKTPPSVPDSRPHCLNSSSQRTIQTAQRGGTIALLQGLEELISKFDSNIDIDVVKGSKSVLQLEEKLETNCYCIFYCILSGVRVDAGNFALQRSLIGAACSLPDVFVVLSS
ncbi:hypothetical protein [Nostoc sp. JL33]|uniref:hypothetical protein n=1 Tax=Nostoc sp. JL33 TaxID=2815396 RepID=UPI003432E426